MARVTRVRNVGHGPLVTFTDRILIACACQNYFHKTRCFIVSQTFAENLLILPQNDQSNIKTVFYATVTHSQVTNRI
jgi:hypothetical protein